MRAPTNPRAAERRISPRQFGGATTRNHSEIRIVRLTEREDELEFVGGFGDELRLNTKNCVVHCRGSNTTRAEDAAKEIFVGSHVLESRRYITTVMLGKSKRELSRA